MTCSWADWVRTDCAAAMVATCSMAGPTMMNFLAVPGMTHCWAAMAVIWMEGGDGDDVLLGGNDNDHVAGDDGDDVVSGGAGDDNLSGGNGRDQGKR